MNKTLITIATLPFLIFAGIRTYKMIDFNQNCGGYLKRAANSNTVELARTEMARAIQYINEKDLNSGYTSILWKTPSEDVGFWSQNIKSSLEELNSIKPDATPLEKSNVLMKLRDTLTDNGSEGTKLIHPNGLEIYPYNVQFWIFGIVSVLSFSIAMGAVTAKIYK